jgi:hypothetical protein
MTQYWNMPPCNHYISASGKGNVTWATAVGCYENRENGVCFGKFMVVSLNSDLSVLEEKWHIREHDIVTFTNMAAFLQFS